MSRRRLFLSWFVPGVIFTLIPKCPMCFAAYFAAATGIGLAISTAANLRIIVMFACVAFPVVATLWPTLRSVQRRMFDPHGTSRRFIIR